MANLRTVADLVNDVLFRSGETQDGGSDFNDQALIYLNRVYREVATGGGALEPQINETWWWLKTEAVITLLPSYDTGTLSVTQNDDAVTISSAPSISLSGYFIQSDDVTDVFKISSHSANATNITLSSPYTGATNTAVSFTAFKTDYTIPSNMGIIAPMSQHRDWPFKINGMSERLFERDWPLSRLKTGAPSRFMMVDDTTVRFNSQGDNNGNYIKVDYNYMALPADLSIGGDDPLIPVEFRHILSDYATSLLLKDKNDNRAADALVLARAGMQAMQRRNRAKWASLGEPGHIFPRGYESRNQRALKTESGLVLG